MNSSDRNPWLRRHRKREHPAARLVCFPYAGGGASVYAPWRDLLPDEIELCAVQLPGREARFSESPLEQFHDELMPALSAGLHFADRVPCWLYGHSLGALLAFEVARRAAASGNLNVAGLIVSGCDAPRACSARQPLHRLPDAELLDKLVELNGTPAAVLTNRPLMELLLPTIRADFALAATYRYEPSMRLGIPVAVFHGHDDRTVSEASEAGWMDETRGTCQLRLFAGDHFFIHQSRQDVVRAIATLLGHCAA